MGQSIFLGTPVLVLNTISCAAWAGVHFDLSGCCQPTKSCQSKSRHNTLSMWVFSSPTSLHDVTLAFIFAIFDSVMVQDLMKMKLLCNMSKKNAAHPDKVNMLPLVMLTWGHGLPRLQQRVERHDDNNDDGPTLSSPLIRHNNQPEKNDIADDGT